jgi:hypothetical protein
MLIALGIAPGLRHLAYCVLKFDGGRQAELLDADVLRGGRTIRDLNVFELAIKYRIHSMILDLVWERHTPTVVGLGPRASTQEPIEYSEFAKAAVMAFSHAVGGGIRTVQVTQKQFPLFLGKSLPVAIRTHVDRPPQVRDPKLLSAIGTALCAGMDTQRPPRERILG